MNIQVLIEVSVERFITYQKETYSVEISVLSHYELGIMCNIILLFLPLVRISAKYLGDSYV